MTDEDEKFPPNSQKSKRVERVTTAEPIRRKKGLGHKFKSVFFKGDPRVITSSVVNGILIPAAKDMFVDAVRDFAEKVVFGETHRTRRNSPPAGPHGYVSYNRMGPTRDPRNIDPPRSISQRARARHEFDEIVLQSRQEAEEVIERLFDLIGQYDTATVSDLYDLVGIRGTHVDHKWGWTDMRGAGVVRVRDGYLLELPDVVPMEM